MTQTFRGAILRAAPKRLRRYWGSRLIYALGIQWDALIDLMVDGITARFPDYTPPDGLAAIGRDRKIRRGFAESAASYAVRLKRWIPDRKTKGNPYTLMRQLQGYLTGYSVRLRTVNNAGAWHTLYADGTTDFYVNPEWDWDGESDPWSRFWVILYAPTALWNPDGTWGQGANYWGDGGVWGLSATYEQGQTIKAIVREWTPPHSTCAGVIVTWDATAFDPTDPEVGDADFPNGNWGRAGKDDGAGNYELVRPQWARFTGEL